MLKQQLTNNNNALRCRANKLCALICVFTVFLFSLSCINEVDLDWPTEEQKYVIGCLFSPENSMELYTFKTTAILEDTILAVDSLQINLYENNSLIWSGNKSNAGKYLIPVEPKPVSQYAISISNSQDILIHAIDTIPLPVHILSATYQYPTYKDSEGEVFGQISLSFQDNPDTKNYYEIILLHQDSTIIQSFNIKSSVITINSVNDPISSESLLFTDELFEGKTLNLKINVASVDTPIIVLKNLSNSYYQYRNNIITHLYNQNTERDDVYNLFKGDPVELYSNVNNALGIFAGFTQDIKTCSKEK